MMKKANFYRLLSIAMACSLCLSIAAPASAAEPAAGSGGGGSVARPLQSPIGGGGVGGGGTVVVAPWAGVDFDGLLDGVSYVYYGEYYIPAMGDYSPGTHPMLYKIMGEEEEDGCLTMMSRYLISSQPYSSDQAGQHYDNSFIRDWLNNDFFTEAFSEAEQGAIVETQVKTSVFDDGIEKTGPVSIWTSGPVANYPLTTSDKIYLPWGNPVERMAYWSSEGAAGPAYQVSQPTTMMGENSSSANLYCRLRTPNYNSNLGFISSPLLFGSYTLGDSLVTLTYSYGTQSNFIARCDIFPIFKLVPSRIVFASQVVPANTATPGPHQIKASTAYPMPETGKAYKLTIWDEGLDPLADGVYSGADRVGANNTLAVEEAGQLELSMDVPAALDGGYSIRYQLLDSSCTLVGYGGSAGPFASGMNSFSLKARGLDGQPLAEGDYYAFTWLQRDNATTSFAASTPQYFHLAVVEPPALTADSAIRSSNSSATVTFTSDKDGTFYYVVLPESEAAPSASEIKGDGTAGIYMLDGENTISLSTLAAGPWKVYIVGEDSNGIDSDVLDITIPAYNAPPLLTGGAATRSSNSNATVTFTSDKDGTCYYVVLHEDEAAPSASAIKGDGTAGMDMLEGKNTISLSTLAAGSWKIYIVGEDSNGIDSDVLGITIPAYNASSPPYGGGSSGGTTIAKPEVPLADPISFPPFIQGFEDKTFRGDGFMTREQFVAILFRLNAEQPATPYAGDPSFGDVPPGRWSFNAVEWAKGEGIIEADEDGNFRPAAPLSRADMATMFVKAEKLTDMAENAFSDIDGHPSADDILKAVKAGIFTGYKDGTFKPDGSTTRNEAVTALIRYLLGKEPAESMWQDTTLALTDTSSTDWAYKYVVLAVDGYTGVPR